MIEFVGGPLDGQTRDLPDHQQTHTLYRPVLMDGGFGQVLMAEYVRDTSPTSGRVCMVWRPLHNAHR